ncbi:MAG: right-handed parallel beta-helix repeat-containing protein [Planctomycetota bacterium]
MNVVSTLRTRNTDARPSLRAAARGCGSWARICLSFALVAGVVDAVSAAEEIDFHVSPSGRDEWSGTLAEPRADGTDGPFATIERARVALRAKRGGQRVVSLRAGTYLLERPLRLGPEDGPAIYRAHPGETPVLSGAAALGAWHVGEDGTWELTVPEELRGPGVLTQLFVGGERRQRPRLPATGYYEVTAEIDPTDGARARGYDRFVFAPGELSSDWPDWQDVEVLCFLTWSMSRFRIAAIDMEAQVVTLAGHTPSSASWAKLGPGRRFLLENVAHTPLAEGSWRLDRARGVLRYRPRPGESPELHVAAVPRLATLVEIVGQPDRGAWVEGVRFEGIGFAHSAFHLPAGGNASAQAETSVPAAVRATGARRCALTRCRLEHLGGYAIEWGAGCQQNQVDDCVLHDLGGGGIRIGGSARGIGVPSQLGQAPAPAIAAGNVIRNCAIVSGGRLHPGAVGVWIGSSPGNRIEHNEIADFYYSGISVGESWGYGPSHAYANQIAYNHLHGLGQGVLSDLGGIYTLGVSPGTVIHHNRIEGVTSATYGAWGLYFDEGSSGIVAQNNLVHDTQGASFHVHYGRDLAVRNNIFSGGTPSPLRRTRGEDHRTVLFERNIVLGASGEFLEGSWQGETFLLRNNLYWPGSEGDARFMGLTLREWQRQRGQDRGSILADPQFADASAGDFRILDSKATKRIGFRPFPLGEAGREPGSSACPPRAQPAFPSVR